MRLQKLTVPAIVATMIALGANAAAAPRQVNDEYGIDVAFPPGGRACVAESGTHPHGLYVRLGAASTPCDAADWTRSMGIYADYNALFERSARAAIAPYCKRDEPAPPALRRAARDLGFPARRSETCVRTRGRVIIITVMTQGGRGPDDDGPSPERRTPWINYRAWLESDPEHLDRDLILFRAMLADTVLRPDQGL